MSQAPERPPRVSRRLQESLWIIPAFAFGLFTWISFFYVGIRARRRDWLLAGAIYAADAGLILSGISRPGLDNDPDDFLVWAMVLTWLVGMFHVVGVNTAWLRYRGVTAGPLAAPAAAPSARRRRRPAPPPAPAAANFGLGDPAADYLADRPVATTGEAAPALDVNLATARAISRLPDVGAALARRIVAERNRVGGFDDLDHMARAVSLQPHVIVGRTGRVTFSPPRPPSGRKGGGGRILDV